MLSLCQVFILISNPNNSTNQNITQIGYTHLNDAFRRLYTEKKRKQQQVSQFSWPKSLFVLYNTTNSIKKNQKSNQHEKQLCQMFRDYNFSILHSKNINDQQQIKTYTTITNPLEQLYLKNTSIIFREMYNKIEGKNYMNIRYMGLTVPHITSQLVYTLNQHNNLYLPKAFNKAKKSTFLSIYNRHALGYLLKMKQYIGQQKPYSTDYLLNAFQNANQATMDEYYQVQRQVAIKPQQDSLCLEYERKLQNYIQEKQKNILNDNNKKSAKQLGNILGSAQFQTENNNPVQTFKKLQQTLLQTNRNFDSNAQSVAVTNALKQLYIQNQNIAVNNQNKGEVVNYGQEVIYEDKPAQIEEKKQILLQKKAQLDQLSYQITQQNTFMRIKFQQDEKNIMNQIQNQQQKIKVMRSHLNSNISGGNSNEQLMAQQLFNQLQQLQNTYNAKMNEKKALQSVLMSKTMPEAQMLQTKLFTRRQQIQNLIKQSQQKMKVMRNGGPLAQRRKIDVRTANIRRVNASQI